MEHEDVKLTIAEQLYPEPESEKSPEPGKEESKTEDIKEPPSPEGHVKDDPVPPSKEGAKEDLDPTNLDWMDKESPNGHPDDEEAKKSDEPDVEIEYNGRKIKASELQQEASNLEAGYTKKQMALAEKQKAAEELYTANETQKAELATSLTEVENFLQSVVEKEPDWDTLKEELDTDEFLLKKMEFDDQKTNLKKVSEHRQALIQEEMDKKAAKEMGILAKDYYPEWSDPKKCEQHIASIISYNEKSYGYKKSELKHIMYDNRLFRMAADAASWRKHKESLRKIESQKTADTLPTTVKSSGKMVKEPTKKEQPKETSEILYPQYANK